MAKMVSSLTEGEDLNQMVKALRKAKDKDEKNIFSIDRDSHAGTLIVTHAKSGKEVLRSINKGGTVWLTRMMDNLFVEQPQATQTAYGI